MCASELEESLDIVMPSAAKLALARALRDLALQNNNATLTLADLLARIEPSWHDAVRNYCRNHGLERFDRPTACAQLFVLLDEGVALEMSDDEEAQLAVLRHQ